MVHPLNIAGWGKERRTEVGKSEQPPPIKLADAMGLMAANMQKTAGSENKHQKAPTVHSSLKNAEVTGRKSGLQVTPSRKPS